MKKIKFTAHTVREFSTKHDFEMFIAYLAVDDKIPKKARETLLKTGNASITTWDGDNQDCKATSTWTIENE